MKNGKKKFQLVAAVERGQGEDKKSFWTRIGTAFPNKDGSYNLRFDYLPTDPGTTIQFREVQPKKD